MTSQEIKEMREWFAKQFSNVHLSDKDIDHMIATMERELPGINIRLEMIAVIRDLMTNPIKNASPVPDWRKLICGNSSF